MARMPVDAVRCTDLAEFLATPGLDAVYVATPNAAHRPLVEAAAAAGKAVLCEKPLAADLPDAEALVEACDAAGVLLGTAYDQRWHPAHVRLRELLPELGTVTAVRIVYCCWLAPDWQPPSMADGPPHDNWRADPAVAGGGAALDLAPHGVDLVGTLLGEDVEELHALVQSGCTDYPVDDGALLHGRTPAGVLVDLHVAYNTPDALPRRRSRSSAPRGWPSRSTRSARPRAGTLTVLDPEARDVPFGSASPFEAQFRRSRRPSTATAPPGPTTPSATCACTACSWRPSDMSEA
jgi:predicted dehydrogenase